MKNIYYFLYLIIFKIILEFSYSTVLIKYYDYDYFGFELDFNAYKSFLSWLIYLSLAFLLNKKIRRPSEFLINFTFFIYISPLLVYYSFSNSQSWILLNNLMQFLIIFYISKLPKIKFNQVRINRNFIILFSLALVFLSTWFFLNSGLIFDANILVESIEQRLDANIVLYGGLQGYIISWSEKVFLPLLLVFSLVKKKRILSFLIFLLFIFWFGISSHKSIIFYPLLIFYLFFVLRKDSNNRSVNLKFFILATGFPLLSYLLFNEYFILSLITRRVFFTPVIWTFRYFNFFDNNQFIYWSNSFLSFIFEYPYDIPYTLLISRDLGFKSVWANNTFFSTGYMHAGLVGTIFYSILVGFILNFIDSSSTKIPIFIALGIVIVPWYSLISAGDLTTTLLTHGLGIALLAIYFLKIKYL